MSRFQTLFIRSTVAFLAMLIAAALPASVAGKLLHPCQSTVTGEGLPAAIAICPAGDGQTLAEVGARIDLIGVDGQGIPVPGVDPRDIWLMGCGGGDPCLWAGMSIGDGPTDENGETSLSGTVAAGGMYSGVSVFAYDIVMVSSPDCSEAICLPVELRSADINNDMIVDIIDLSILGAAFTTGPYNPAADFTFDGVVDLEDLTFLGEHFGHSCH